MLSPFTSFKFVRKDEGLAYIVATHYQSSGNDIIKYADLNWLKTSDRTSDDRAIYITPVIDSKTAQKKLKELRIEDPAELHLFTGYTTYQIYVVTEGNRYPVVRKASNDYALMGLTASPTSLDADTLMLALACLETSLQGRDYRLELIPYTYLDID